MPTDELPAYLKIAADLRARIAEGEFAPGSRLPTEGEQAAHAHVVAVQRTYFAQGEPVETADIVIPSDRYELVYRAPVHP